MAGDPTMRNSVLKVIEQMNPGEALAVHEMRNKWQDLAGRERTVSGTGGMVAVLTSFECQGLVVLTRGMSGGLLRIVKPVINLTGEHDDLCERYNEHHIPHTLLDSFPGYWPCLCATRHQKGVSDD